MSATTLTIHGAAGCVTGSCYRLQTSRGAILVDCGMFQGSKSLKALNYEPFPFDPKGLDAVLLTHAHIDHSGLLPKLERAGYRGPIWATAGTHDLCEVMLADSAHIQESEVEQLNRRNQRRGRPTVTPIYGKKDAARTMELFRRVKLGEQIEVAPGVTARWWNAGHILGSASIEVTVSEDDGPLRLFFSGDIGPGGRDFLADPEGPAGIDHLIMESTYGDRERPALTPDQRRGLLAAEVRAAYAAGGPLLMPAFAVERTQELLADLLEAMERGEAPKADVFLDSPLAIQVTDVFLRRGYNATAGGNPFEALHAGERLRFLSAPSESDQLERLRGWHVIMAASGMCDAGRIRKHLKRLLWREDATVLLTGFQVQGSLGRLLADGASRVRIQGEDIRVRAKVRSLDVYSGHADAAGLAAWALARRPVAGKVFLCHGEPSSAQALAARLAAAGMPSDRLVLPVLDQSFALSTTGAAPLALSTGRATPAAPAGLDWHNARAALLGELDARLEAESDDAERAGLIEAIRGLLAAPGREQTGAIPATVEP